MPSYKFRLVYLYSAFLLPLPLLKIAWSHNPLEALILNFKWMSCSCLMSNVLKDIRKIWDGSQNSLFHSFKTLQALVTPGVFSVFENEEAVKLWMYICMDPPFLPHKCKILPCVSAWLFSSQGYIWEGLLAFHIKHITDYSDLTWQKQKNLQATERLCVACWLNL